MSEGLTTGWEAGLETDTLLRAFSEATASRIGSDGTLTEDFAAKDSGTDLWIASEATVRGIPNDDKFRDLAAFYPRGRGFGCYVPTMMTTAPPGYEIAGHPPFMVRPPGGQAPESHLTTRRLSGGAEYRLASQIVCEAFDVDTERWDDLFDSALEDSNQALYGTFDDGQLVATASSWPDFGVNLIEYVAVPPSLHRRGYGAAATWAATLHAPDVPSVLLASDPGQPVYARMGYLRICRTTFLKGTGTG